MLKNFPNHLVLGNECDDAIGPAAVANQRVGLMHTLDEVSPAFSESGTLFWRKFEGVFGWGGWVGAEGLKGEASLFPVGPGFRRIGPEITKM